MSNVERAVLKTVVLFDVVDSTGITARLGDVNAASLWSDYSRRVRDLLQSTGGQEIDQSDGFLVFFDRPIDAVRFSLSLNEAMESFTAEKGFEIASRTGKDTRCQEAAAVHERFQRGRECQGSGAPR